MPDIPAKAVLDLGSQKLFIDGVEFPYAMTAEGPVLANRADGICTVTLSLLVDAVEVRPIPERSEAECVAEANLAVARQQIDKANGSGDPGEIEAAQFRLQCAEAESARFGG